MKKFYFSCLLLFFPLVILLAQENAVRLSIESFFSDEGPIISKDYIPEDFSGVTPFDPNTYLTSGIEKLEAGFFAESQKDFNETIILAPGCGICFYYRGVSYLMMDSLEMAKKDFQTAIYHDVLIIQAYNDLSSIYFYENKLDSAELILEKGISFYPAYLPTYFNLGYYKLLRGRQNKALKLFDKCMELDTCHAESVAMKAAVFLTNGKLKETESLLDKFGGCNQPFTDFYLLNSIVKYKRNKIIEAIEEVNKALKIENKYNYYFLRGLLFAKTEQYSLAIDDFIKSYQLNLLERKDHHGSYSYRMKQLDYQGILQEFSAQKKNFDDKEIQYIEKGICLLMNEDYLKAGSELKKLTKSNGNNDFYYLLFGLAKEKSFDTKTAFANYNKCIELNNKNAEAYKRRGLLYQDDGAFSEAMNDFNAMYEINPQSSEALKYRGIAKMLDKRYDLAFADFNEYEQKFESDSDIFFNKAQCQNQMGMLEDAIISYTKVLNLNPLDIDVIYQIAQNNYSLGKLDESMTMCDSILNNTNCHVMTTNLKGVIQMDLNEYEKAISTFKSGIVCSPRYVDFYINKGIALIKLGRNEDAIKQIDLTLTIAPYSGLAYLTRAQAKHNLGDKSACEDLDKAIKFGIQVTSSQRDAICK